MSGKPGRPPGDKDNLTPVLIDCSPELLGFLVPGRIRELSDVQDLCALVLKDLLEGRIPMQASERIRKHLELIMATTVAKAPKAVIQQYNTTVEQLIQAEQVNNMRAITPQVTPQIAAPKPTINFPVTVDTSEYEVITLDD